MYGLTRAMSTPVPRSSLHSMAMIGLATAGATVSAGWPITAWGPWILVGWGALVALMPPSGSLVACIVAATIVRIPFLFAAPLWSDDVYRYVWEGRVWASGANPFAFAPDSEHLAALRDANWALVNHKQVSSIYPPLAQALFLALAPGGVLAWKVAMAACDVGTAALLHRRRAPAGWLWAVLPLPALESAGSGHLEGIALLFTALALGD